ncbi:hypothetical protein BaRGS_00037467 [Batillaria attramentaria]|uniref:Uncharacterized protein n=1 Tax=Batillaria attramentaria TaxID=370345 RepID=A0ABD0J8K5_9CAEN
MAEPLPDSVKEGSAVAHGDRKAYGALPSQESQQDKSTNGVQFTQARSADADPLHVENTTQRKEREVDGKTEDNGATPVDNEQTRRKEIEAREGNRRAEAASESRLPDPQVSFETAEESKVEGTDGAPQAAEASTRESARSDVTPESDRNDDDVISKSDVIPEPEERQAAPENQANNPEARQGEGHSSDVDPPANGAPSSDVAGIQTSAGDVTELGVSPTLGAQAAALTAEDREEPPSSPAAENASSDTNTDELTSSDEGSQNSVIMATAEQEQTSFVVLPDSSSSSSIPQPGSHTENAGEIGSVTTDGQPSLDSRESEPTSYVVLPDSDQPSSDFVRAGAPDSAAVESEKKSDAAAGAGEPASMASFVVLAENEGTLPGETEVEEAASDVTGSQTSAGDVTQSGEPSSDVSQSQGAASDVSESGTPADAVRHTEPRASE